MKSVEVDDVTPTVRFLKGMIDTADAVTAAHIQWLFSLFAYSPDHEPLQTADAHCHRKLDSAMWFVGVNDETPSRSLQE